MTLQGFINRFQHLRTTMIGIASWVIGGLVVADRVYTGGTIPWEFVGLCGLIGLLAMNSYDGGL